MKTLTIFIGLLFAHQSFALDCSVQSNSKKKRFNLEMSTTIFDSGSNEIGAKKGVNAVIKTYSSKEAALNDLGLIKDSYLCSDELTETYCKFGLDEKTNKLTIGALKQSYPDKVYATINTFEKTDLLTFLKDFEILNKNGVCNNEKVSCYILKDGDKFVATTAYAFLYNQYNRMNTRSASSLEEANILLGKMSLCRKENN